MLGEFAPLAFPPPDALRLTPCLSLLVYDNEVIEDEAAPLHCPWDCLPGPAPPNVITYYTVSVNIRGAVRVITRSPLLARPVG